jgi:hypothetical protein
MNTNTKALLERARALCEPPSWYQLSKRTGIAPATLTRCMKHQGTLDNEAAWKLAQLLSMQPADVVAYMEEDRAKSAKAKAWWRAKLPRLLSAAGFALSLIPAHGLSVSAAGSSGATFYTLCVPRRYRMAVC